MGFLWAVTILLLAQLFIAENGVFEYMHLRDVYKKTERMNQKVLQDNRRLSREITLLRNDPAYRMRKVRKHLHYLGDREIMYIFPQESKETGE